MDPLAGETPMANQRNLISLCMYKGRNVVVGFAFICLLLAMSTPSKAQTILNSNNVSPEPVAQQPLESIDDALVRIQELLVDARQKLIDAQTNFDSVTPSQLGSTAEEMQGKLSMLYERVRIYQQHIEAYKALKETRAASKERSVDIENWKGFEQTPPYPISLVDRLRDEIHSEELKIKKEGVKLSIANNELEDARRNLKAAEQSLRKLKEDLENPNGTINQARLQWLYSLSQLENTNAKAKTLAAETQRTAINEALSNCRKNLEFLNHKLQIASSNAFFSKEEYDTILGAIDEGRKEAEKALREAIREDLSARERMEEAREALKLARENSNGEKQVAQEVDRLQEILNMRMAWSDTTSQIVEGLELNLHEFNTEEMVWEKRYRLSKSWNEAELKESLGEADKKLEELRSRQSYFQSNLDLTRGLLIAQQNRLASLEPTNGYRDIVRQALDAYTRRAAFYGRGLARFDKLIQLLEHWRFEIGERRQQIPFAERLRTILKNSLEVAGSVWDYELFSAEDTVFIDGQPITERRPVTVSKAIRALIILAIGFWLSAVLARRLRRMTEKHLRIEQSGAGLIEKTVRSIIIICVVFFALVTVKIPLTIFAFLGGALAIGIGFGAQNLINNFISGIILLLERPIRVGDIVEIDGTRGKVTSIGARCSEIKCFGGIDMLVPNSSFLEKNVVNWTHSDNLLRLSVTVGVAYGSPTEKVSDLISDALKEHEKILKFPEPVILFEEFGDSSLVFTVYFWIEILSQMDFRIVASDLRHILDKRLREAGITIAFPQRDVHFDHPRPIQIQLMDKEQLENPKNLKPNSG